MQELSRAIANEYKRRASDFDIVRIRRPLSPPTRAIARAIRHSSLTPEKFTKLTSFSWL